MPSRATSGFIRTLSIAILCLCGSHSLAQHLIDKAEFSIPTGVMFLPLSISMMSGTGEIMPDPPVFIIIRTTTGSAGSSKRLETPSGKYYINQSIGQESVIGTHRKRKYGILHGYQQPLLRSGIFQFPSDGLLMATIYPNPFSQSMNILFREHIVDNVFLEVVDMNGKTILSKKYAASNLVHINLNGIAAGVYILKLKTGKKTLSAKLVKD